jgi:CheY-like chemotaxis protein
MASIGEKAWRAWSCANSDVVLIVDDVPDNLAVLHDALDESGYTVLVALSGAAALQRAAQALPDVVLLDAMMPGMDGFEVARQLKADPQTAHIPIIFMTGLLDIEHLVAALEAGGDWLIIMQEVSDESVIEAMGLCFKLTPKEAEVLYWVVKGKINRDIGDIVGSSPMTVKKHLEHVFAKLGVETRTAAAMAMRRIRQLQPQFEG